MILLLVTEKQLFLRQLNCIFVVRSLVKDAALAYDGLH